MHPIGSRTVVHLSDLHFGRENRHVLPGLRDAVWTLEPSVVAVSGDLTQRARGWQFRRARAFLDSLPMPHLVVPGNHDLPLFNIASRLLNPLGGYKWFITRDLQPTISDERLWITGVDTTRPSRWKGGRVRPAAVDHLQASIREAPLSAIKILVAHHPFDAPERKHADAQTIETLTLAGIDVFLTGHLHSSYAGHTAHRYRTAGRSAVVVEAGTATSTRLREESNGFNVLRLRDDTIDVEMHAWNGRAFIPTSTRHFTRTELGWSSREESAD